MNTNIIILILIYIPSLLFVKDKIDKEYGKNQIVAERISIDLDISNFLVRNLIESHFSSNFMKKYELSYIFVPNNSEEMYFERYSKLSFYQYGKWEIINSNQGEERNIKIIIEYKPKMINLFYMCRMRKINICYKNSESLKDKLNLLNIKYGYIKSYFVDNEFWTN